MLDFQTASKIMLEHFATLTPEQFLINLEEYCPELFQENSTSLDIEQLKNTEIYQQAEKESKLKIVPKLLEKGLNIQEVAELLELDLETIKQTSNSDNSGNSLVREAAPTN
jgi:predicted transposase YdaD